MSMSAEERAQDLIARGYVEVQEIGRLKVGQRVRHGGQRGPEAVDAGTGVLERIFHNPDSAWERRWHQRDVEVIVKRDRPEFGNDHGFWADYDTAVVEVAS